MTDCPSCKGTGKDYRCKWCGKFLQEDQECPECSAVTDDPVVFESSIRECDCPTCDGYGEVSKATIKEIQLDL